VIFNRKYNNVLLIIRWNIFRYFTDKTIYHLSSTYIMLASHTRNVYRMQ